jgi:hypothetical protein
MFSMQLVYKIFGLGRTKTYHIHIFDELFYVDIWIRVI